MPRCGTGREAGKGVPIRLVGKVGAAEQRLTAGAVALAADTAVYQGLKIGYDTEGDRDGSLKCENNLEDAGDGERSERERPATGKASRGARVRAAGCPGGPEDDPSNRQEGGWVFMRESLSNSLRNRFVPPLGSSTFMTSRDDPGNAGKGSTLAQTWLRCGALLFLCASVLHVGCLYGTPFLATYPETYDASDFQQFVYRVDHPRMLCGEMPPMSDSPWLRPLACEAMITRNPSGEYFLEMVVRRDEQSALTEVPQREMTEEEIQGFLELSAELRINRHPRPFCTVPLPYSVDFEYFLQWDDLEVVGFDCDRPRLDIRQVFYIETFVNSLIPDVTVGRTRGDRLGVDGMRR
ncbi:MAG: hypothetical protein HY763_02430 [Planctomycetes bacterium]|nr:hypothetical protein [Planctomycetota bacterium]